jgi:hypothetical protein
MGVRNVEQEYIFGIILVQYYSEFHGFRLLLVIRLF